MPGVLGTLLNWKKLDFVGLVPSVMAWRKPGVGIAAEEGSKFDLEDCGSSESSRAWARHMCSCWCCW